MTEGEWLECTDPSLMELFLGENLSERKLRLFGCACVRGVWADLPAEVLRQAIETCERFADGLATDEELEAARELADRVCRDMEGIIADHSAIAVTALCEPKPWFPMGEGSSAGIAAVAAELRFDEETPWEVVWAQEKQAHCERLREILGNPFRPTLFDPAWRTSSVMSLAQAAYEERLLPAGTLDSARLAVLSDALEDAGSTDAEILSHLRGPGPHVRGCWVVDLLLGKE
jgi:hypothetical protein